MDDIERKILIEALINAKEYDGKTNPKAVLGKLMGKYPEFRKEAKTIAPKVNKIISEKFPMDIEEVDNLLNELDPDALSKRQETVAEQKRVVEKTKGKLVDLPNAVEGKLVVRLAPDPSKYPHIGQLLNYTINSMYAEKYKGKIVLRFDDTNPAKVKPEFYRAIKEGMKWGGITWDIETRASEHIEEFYEVARTFINNGDFYVCTCEHEVMRKNREDMVECACRGTPTEKILEQFEQMLQGKLKHAIIRLVGDMKSDNPVMRDPVMFRNVDEQHPMLDKFYAVWPTYDFESPYLDWKYKVTHILRSGEFGPMRQEQQSYIIKKLGGEVPVFFSYGRYNIKGCPLKGRVLRDLVERKVVTGWDDIRLFTVEGWKKRGIQPEVLKVLIRENGTTPKNSTIDWSVVERYNKKILEPKSMKIFGVRTPVKVSLDDPIDQLVELPFSPTSKQMRSQHVSDIVYMDKDDADRLEKGDLIRLKDLINIEILGKGEEGIKAKVSEGKPNRNIKKIQWVAEYVETDLLVPSLLEPKKNVIDEESLRSVKMYLEKSILLIEGENYYQIERVGYAKLTVSKNAVNGHIIHLI